MAAEQAWYVAERAEALAIVYLTRRDDLEVTPVSRYMPNPKYDLLVRIKDDQVSTPFAFAVEVKGQLSQPRKMQGDRFTFTLSKQVLEGSGLPTCIFLFDVELEQGYYCWLYRPALSQQGAELALDFVLPEIRQQHNGQLRVTGRFAPLDNEAIAAIVEQVKAWYEAGSRPRAFPQTG